MLLSSFPHSNTISKNAIILTFCSRNVCSFKIFGNLLIKSPFCIITLLNSWILPLPRVCNKWKSHSNSEPLKEFMISLSSNLEILNTFICILFNICCFFQPQPKFIFVWWLGWRARGLVDHRIYEIIFHIY